MPPVSQKETNQKEKDLYYAVLSFLTANICNHYETGNQSESSAKQVAPLLPTLEQTLFALHKEKT